MRRNLVIFCLLAWSACEFAASGPAVTKAYADDKGSIHILTADGREHTIEPEKWQNGGGFTDVDIAPDGRTVGWVVNQMLDPLQGGTNYAYAVSVGVEIWRDAKVMPRISPNAYVIQNWIFLKNGDEVAIHTAPPHGQEFYDCMRFDVRTGKKLAHWRLDRRDYVVPEWAQPLLANDPLPGPDEISNWIPDGARKKQK